MTVSSCDGQPVLAVLAETAARLAGSTEALIYRKDGDQVRLVARHGPPGTGGRGGETAPLVRSTIQGRAILESATIRAGGLVATPMIRNGAAVGVIVARRGNSRALSSSQAHALEAFAVQAAVVIQELEERDRELTDTRAQYAATAEIVRAISSSTDMQQAFDMIAENAVKLCHGQFGGVFQFDGGLVHLLAQHGLSPEGVDVYARSFPRAPGRDTAIGRALLDRAIVHIQDVQNDPEYGLTTLAMTGTIRCVVAVPVLREGHPIGGIVAWRSKPEPFPDRQIELLRTFADQTLIAIENARLVAALGARNLELTENLEQQTATAEILRAISGSVTDLQPVLDTVVRAAARFCGATDVVIFRLEGQTLRGAAGVGRFAEVIASQVGGSLAGLQFPLTRGSVTGRAVLDRRTVHIHDVAAEPEDEFPEGRDLQRRFGYGTVVATPLLREGTPLGGIALFRAAVDPFSDRQLELLRTFADQAVIAIENVRLFTALKAKNRDLTETLEQQTATAEILRVISSSPTDVQPVFDTIAESAKRLCGAQFCQLYRFDGTLLHFVAHHGLSPEGVEAVRRAYPMAPGRASAAARSVLSGVVQHIPDVDADPDYGHGAVARTVNFQSIVGVPMLRDGVPIGSIAVARVEAGPFPDRQLALLQTFADQAVIAIENVRLFTELEAKNRDLTETLEQQTATGEILRVISSSPTDVQPVFDTIAVSALRLCDAKWSAVTRFDGHLIELASHHGLTDPAGIAAVERAFPRKPSPHGATDRAIMGRVVGHYPDVLEDRDYQFQDMARAAGYRSMLAVPMVREGQVVGAITVAGATARTFSDRQIELLKTFADQAVIAIENVRLFKEFEARNRDLTDTLEQQTATGDILRVISGSPTDVQPVFDTIAENARRLCDAEFCAVFRFDGALLHFVAHHGVTAEGVEAWRRRFPVAPDRGSGAGRAVLGAAVEQIPDVDADPDYRFGELARIVTFRSLVAVPILRDGRPIGAITVNRSQAGFFPARQIELLKTFADQAVIAIENVRLFRELEARNAELTATLARHTATSEVLRAISRAQTDAQPVFDIIAASALRLCGGGHSGVWLYDGQLIHLAALDNANPEGAEAIRHAYPMPADQRSSTGRAVLARGVVQVRDVLEDRAYGLGHQARALGFRSFLAAPMLRDGEPIGVIGVGRPEPGPFPDQQIELLQTFADQAVIAIENVRLFRELEARTQELTRSVGELRALGEVSQAVSSTLDLETVLETIVSRAVQLSGSDGGIVYEFEEGSQSFHARATHRISPAHLEAVRAAPIRLGEGAVGRAGVSREPVQVTDVQEEWRLIPPHVRALHTREGTRSLLAVPLVREERLLGGLVIMRRELAAFSPEVVATLQAFATQSVLAIHNAGLFREIERRKQYADAIVDTSPVAIVTIDLGGRVVGWNPGAERLFGYSEMEALGRRPEELVATPDVLEEVRANLEKTLEGEWIRAIGRRARKDGTLVDVEISSVPVVVDGAKMGMIGIYHDITDLLRARREAEAANEAKSAFLATMSHEIRTPMNAVIGMSGLLLGTSLTDEQREYAEVVRQSGDTLLTVINDILDFSKIEAGKLELEAQPFDLRECVEGALDLVATRAAEKSLDLAYLLADGTPAAVVGDVTRVRQILLNLLSNAVKFTEHGEVVLSVSARRPDVASPLHELTFSVRDTGIGIPPDRLGRLFQSFSQVDASTTRRYGGTGLGLAISQRLTELMGGRISVTSEKGRGSEFRVTFPAAATEGPASTRRDLSGVQPSLRGKRVLVVDDNATNRRILAAHLDAWGMTVRATGSPRESLGWIRADERFDVGILDMHMPEMDGVALAREIRGHPAGTALPLVLFTSLGRREARAEEEGFAAYLHKPIKPSQLFDALATVLAERPVHMRERGAPRGELDPDMARRHPLRILLAEDNVVNQKVALRILGQMGYRADVAGNGLEAIDAVARQTYDVVLMDVQMPELDGFEASRELNRRWPGERPRIVAMTANAMQGDRELCAAAGMDDYVAKPIRVEELVAALERSSRRPEVGGRSTVAADIGEPSSPAGLGPSAGSRRLGSPGEARAPASKSAPAAAAIDRAVVERLTATMGGAFVSELIDTFLADARELIATLERALGETDLDAFRRAAHSLKSTSESLGAVGLAALARELEATARTGTLEGVETRIAQLGRVYETATRTLRELRLDHPG